MTNPANDLNLTDADFDAEVASEEAFAATLRSCPGWGCGNLMTTPDADLCGDCHAARLDAQSPRIHF